MAFRSKLFGVSVVLIAVAGLSALAYLEPSLRDWAYDRIEGEVLHHARAARVLMESTDVDRRIGAVDPLADRLGEATGARITIIAASGRVLGDSSLPESDVATVENHADRPEVRRAQDSGRGTARRYSTTLDREMLYVALPFGQPTRRGFVRASLPLRAVGDAVGRLRIFLAVAAAIGLAVAIFMSALASHLVTRNLSSILSRARRMVRGARSTDSSRDDLQETDDETSELNASVSRLSEDLEGIVDQLARQRDRIGAVLESMSEAVIVVDDQRAIDLVNDAALKLLDIDANDDETEQLEGRVVTRVIGRPEIIELIDEARRGEQPSLEFPLPTEPERHVVGRASREPTSGGVVIVMHDVTELRRLERMRRDFVANVSHELRTPVGIIRAATESLRDGAIDEPEHAERFLDSLLRTSERLGNLIDDLLDISRLEAGRYVLEMEPTSVADIVDSILSDVARQAEDNGVTLVNDTPADIRVMGDPDALDQVLLNLVGNAVKYTPEGGHVIVGAQLRQREHGSSAGDGEADREVLVEVRDDGPGIPADEHDRIFERFYRVDSGRSRDQGGTGLGLAIVKHLVTSMGGRVGYKPNPDAEDGSIFWFTLPPR